MNEQPNTLKFDRLPLTIRNELQKEIIKRMIKEKIVSSPMEWMDDYRSDVSDIIDDTNNAEIQSLAKSGEYERATELVLEKLMVTA